MRAAQDLASRRYAGRGQLQIYPGMRCQCLPAALGAPVRCLSPGQQADVDAVNAQPTSHFAVVVRPPPSALTGALSTSACLVTSHGGFWEPHRGPRWPQQFSPAARRCGSLAKNSLDTNISGVAAATMLGVRAPRAVGAQNAALKSDPFRRCCPVVTPQ